MSYQKYTLEVISHLPQFKNKTLRKHYVDGIETIGAWGDEPFEIKFKNNTNQKIQVKLSLDGTDILTGKPADTEVSQDMWVVNGYETLNLKAWPETSNGGASFVFTSANNSVAAHTHGNLSSRGIIAAAIFVEGHVNPPLLRIQNHYHHHYKSYPVTYIPTIFPYYNGALGDITCGGNIGSINNIASNFSLSNSTVSINSCDASNASTITYSDNRADVAKNLESLVSVGAGEHVDQKITYVSGLVTPTFTETMRVRYMWWDDLVVRLKETNVAAPHASGFPGDQDRKMNLGTTPRVGGSFHRSEDNSQSYFRI